MEIMKFLVQLKLLFLSIFMLMFGTDNDGTSELHTEENNADEDLSTYSDVGEGGGDDIIEKIVSSKSTLLVEDHSNSDDFVEMDNTAEVNKMDVNETNKKDDTVKVFCDICLCDNTESKSECFCVECVQYLCKNCHWCHKKCTVTKEHKVISENISEVSVYKLMGRLLSCNVHPNLKVTHYCQNHRIHLCLSCIVENHRKCIITDNKLDVVPYMRSKGKKILTHMDIHKQCIASHIAHCKTNVESITLAKEELFHSVRDQTDSLIEAVLDMRKKTEAEIQRVAEEAIKSLQGDIDVCEGLGLGEFEERELVEFLERHEGNEDSKTVALVIWSNVMKNKSTLSHLDSRTRRLHFTRNPLELNKGTLGYVSVCFEDNPNSIPEPPKSTEHSNANEVQPYAEDVQLPKGFASSTIQSTNKENVVCDVSSKRPKVKECKSEHTATGQLSETKNGSAIDSSKAHIALDTGKLVISEVPTLRPDYSKKNQMLQISEQFRKMNAYKKVYLSCIDVHYIKMHNDEAECSISKCVVLKSGCICLIDSSNKKLKKIDPTFNKCLSTKLEGTVSDICNPKDELVAMICVEEHTISVVDLHGDIFSTVRNILLPKHQSFKCITKDEENERFILLYETMHDSVNFVIQFRNYSGSILCNLALNNFFGMSILVPSNSMNIDISYTSKGLVLVGKVIGVRRVTLDFDKLENKINLMKKECKILGSITDNDHLEGMTSMACDSRGNIYTCTTPDDGSIYEYPSFKSYRPTRIASGINGPTCVDCISERKVLVCFSKGDCVHVYNMKHWDYK